VPLLPPRQTPTLLSIAATALRTLPQPALPDARRRCSAAPPPTAPRFPSVPRVACSFLASPRPLGTWSSPALQPAAANSRRGLPCHARLPAQAWPFRQESHDLLVASE